MSSDIDAIQPPAAPPATPPHLNTLQRLTGVLFSPDETFADIARKPNIVAPLVLYLIIGWAAALLTISHIDFEAMPREQMESTQPNMPEADMERMVKFQAGLTKGFFYIQPVVATLVFAFVAFVFWLAFKIFGGAGTYQQAFSVTLYAWLPVMISSIAVTAVVLVTNRTVDIMELQTLLRSSPAFLVDRKDSPVLFALLGSFDIFTLWTLFLFTVGFAHVSKFTKAKAAAIVGAIWGILLLFKVGGAALGAMAAKKASAS
jgi:hypothetical protein